MARHGFGRFAQQDPQLDLFAVAPSFVLETLRSDDDGSRNWRGRWKGDYAGSIHEVDGEIRAWSDHGYIIHSHFSGGTHSYYLGAFETIDAAARALEIDAEAARGDPTLIWTLNRTKEEVRRAKDNGWWRKAA